MKKKNCNNILILMAAAFFVLSGCYYDIEEELYPGSNPITDCDTVTVSFANEVFPLMQTKCAISGCHLNQQSPLFTSYQNIAGNKDRIRARAVIAKDMPPPASGITLTDAERKLINDWICQGALNN